MKCACGIYIRVHRAHATKFALTLTRVKHTLGFLYQDVLFCLRGLFVTPISCTPSLLYFRINPQAQTWWNQVTQCCSLYPHPPHSAFRPRDLLHHFYKPSSLQLLWHHCYTTHHSPCCPSHLLKVHQPLHGHSQSDGSRKSDDLFFSV